MAEMHLLDLDSDVFVTMVRELADRRIPVDPTLITYHTKFFGDDPRWTHHPELRLVPELAAWWRSGGGWVADWTSEDRSRPRPDPSLDIRNTRTIPRVIQGGRVMEPTDLIPLP